MISAGTAIAGWLLLFLAWTELPPEVPLWYHQVQLQEQLAPKWWLLVIPSFVSVSFGFHALAGVVWQRWFEPILLQLWWWGHSLIMLAIVMTLLRIIWLVS